MLSDEYANIEKKVKKDLDFISESLKDDNKKLKKCLKDFVSENYESEVESDVDTDEERKNDGEESDGGNGEEENQEEKDDDDGEEEEEEEEKRKGSSDKKKTKEKSSKKKDTNSGSKEYQENALESEETQPETVADTSEAPVSTPPSSQESEKTQVQLPEIQIETTATIQSAPKTSPTEDKSEENQIASAQLRNPEQSDNVSENQLPASSEQFKHMDCLNNKKTKESIGLDRSIPLDEHDQSQLKGKTQEIVSSKEKTVIETPGSISSEEQIEVHQPKRSTDADIVLSSSKKDVESIAQFEKPVEEFLDVPEGVKVDDMIVSDGPTVPSDEHDPSQLKVKTQEIVSSKEKTVIETPGSISSEEQIEVDQPKRSTDADIVLSPSKKDVEPTAHLEKPVEEFLDSPESAKVDDIIVSDEPKEPISGEHDATAARSLEDEITKSVLANVPVETIEEDVQSKRMSDADILKPIVEQNAEQVPLPDKSGKAFLYAPDVDGTDFIVRVEVPDWGELFDGVPVESEVEKDIAEEGNDAEEPQAVDDVERGHGLLPSTNKKGKKRKAEQMVENDPNSEGTSSQQTSAIPKKKTSKKRRYKKTRFTGGRKRGRPTESVANTKHENQSASSVVLSVSQDTLKTRFAESDARFAVQGILSFTSLSPEQEDTLFRAAKLKKEKKISALAFIDPSCEYDGSNYRGLDSYFKNVITPDVTPMSHVEGEEWLQPRLTGPIHIDPLTTNAENIKDFMKNYKKKHVNPVYHSTTKICLPEGNLDQCTRDQKFYKEKAGYAGEREKDAPGMLLATPCVDLNKLEGDELKNVLDNLPYTMAKFPISVVRGIPKASGIDNSLFDFDRISEDLKTYQTKKVAEKNNEDTPVEEEEPPSIEVLRQFSQASDTNWTFLEGDSPWKTFGLMTEVTFEEFEKNYRKIQELCKEAAKKVEMASGQEEMEVIVAKLIEDLRKEQLKCNFKEGSEEKKLADKLCNQYNPLMTSFGTNFDMEKEAFPEQYETLRNLPAGFQPDGPDDLLKHSGRVFPGINLMQMYPKGPGSQTQAHIETAALCSVNKNLGPASCTWYGVPPEFAGRLEKLIQEKFPTNLGEDKEASIYGIKPWPSIKDLEENEIPYYQFIQEPNDMVFVSPLTFHWVQTTGFTRNVSYNVALPTKTQLQCMIVMYDHCTSRGTPAIIPVPQILWKMAEEGYYGEDGEDMGIFETIKFPLTKLHAHAEFEYAFRGNSKKTVRAESLLDQFCKKCERNIVNFCGYMVEEPDYNYCLKCIDKKRGKKVFMYERSKEELRQCWGDYVHPQLRGTKGDEPMEVDEARGSTTEANELSEKK